MVLLGLPMILLIGCQRPSPASPKQTLRGQFKNGKNFFAIDDLKEKDVQVTYEMARHRLVRYAYFRHEPEIFITPTAILAVVNNGKQFAGYIDGPNQLWVMGDCPSGDWREALKSVPDDDVPSLATISTKQKIAFEPGYYELGNGDRFPIPSDWRLMDEWLGTNPAEALNTLSQINSTAWCNIQVTGKVIPKGMVKYQQLHMKEQSGKLRHFISDKTGATTGFAIELTNGFLVMHHERATPAEMKEIEKAATYIASNLK